MARTRLPDLFLLNWGWREAFALVGVNHHFSQFHEKLTVSDVIGD